MENNNNSELSLHVYTPLSEDEFTTLESSYPNKETITIYKKDLKTEETQELINNLTNKYHKASAKSRLRYENAERIQRICKVCALAFGITTLTNYILETSNPGALWCGVGLTALMVASSFVGTYSKQRCSNIQNESDLNLKKLNQFVAQNK